MRRVIAEALAHADGEEQAELFNEFVARLEDACRHHDKEASDQCYHIAEYLTTGAASWFKELVGSYDFHKDQAHKTKLSIESLNKHKRELEEQIRTAEARLEAAQNA